MFNNFLFAEDRRDSLSRQKPHALARIGATLKPASGGRYPITLASF
jgi:hypothetical protein